MGLIRILLACSVAIGHTSETYWFRLTEPSIAVQAFYLISGFYISLILARDYRRLRDFYENRLLRLLPTYWCVAAAALVFFSLTQRFLPRFAALPVEAAVPFAFSQCSLLGIDLSMFTGVNAGHLGFVRQYQQSNPPLHDLLLLPQAWSLGVELWFYLVAPLIVRRRTWIIAALAALSLGCRLLLIRAGFSGDPWSYRFFPNELALFLVGVLANRWYLRSPENFVRRRAWGWACLVADIAAIVLFSAVRANIDLKRICLLAVLAAGLPFVFALTKDSRWDRIIGDLSYPVYICHLLLGSIWTSVLGPGHLTQPWPETGLLILVALAALGLRQGVERPIEKFRDRIRLRSAQARSEWRPASAASSSSINSAS